MKSGPSSSPAPSGLPAWAPRAIGGLLVAVGLAALVWTALHCWVQVRFRKLATVDMEHLVEGQLASYSIQLEKLLRLDPANGAIRNRYASVLGKQRDFKKAIEELQRARRTENAQNSLFFLATMYEKDGQFDTALEVMADCVALNPTEPAFNDALLRLYHERVQRLKAQAKDGRPRTSDEYREAIRAFGQAARNWAVRAQSDPNAYLFLANYYVEPLYALQSYRCFLLGLARLRPLGEPDLGTALTQLFSRRIRRPS